MTFAAGTTIGRYEIRSKIGEGGMGEVYLAHDTQLDREIALKILPAEIARDQQRLHRFLQEARTASSLSHPNVAHIYEIGESGGAHFIAMEYVAGTPLDKKIGGRPLSVSEILEIAIQIADALDEAHAKGITHRDIKSSNVRITARGRVKVLDFGLAKLAAPSSVIDRTSDSQLATRVKTSPGVVMGTVNYMSPEQALGREVDHRSDIFSFGVVLYEMVTGRLPFTGETVTETIDRIAHAQPEAIARLNYEAPAELEAIVKKALRKDRDERYQAIHDALVDLKELKRELDISDTLERSAAPSSRSVEIPTQLFDSSPSGRTSVSRAAATTSIPPSQTTGSAEYPAKSTRNNVLLVGGVAAIVVVGLGVLVTLVGLAVMRYYLAGRAGVNRRLAPSANMKITRLTSNGRAVEATISPDGKWVVYVQRDGAKRSLRVRQIATTSDIEIVPPTDARFGQPTFSRDGNYLYYLFRDQANQSGALYQAPSLGGPPRKLLTDIASPIAFSPDGKQFVFIRNNEAVSGEDQLIVANADGGGEQKLAARRGDQWFNRGGCGWSPDGKVIACPGGSYSGGYHDTVIAIDANTGTQTEFPKQKFSGSGRVSWLADGSGVLIDTAEQNGQLSQLWLISYPSGEVRRITSDLNHYSGTSFAADSNMLVTVQNDDTANIWVAPTSDIEHGRQITTGKIEGTRGSAWTPDGRVVYTTNINGDNDIWIMNADGSNQKPLTTDPHEDQYPLVSSDGRYVVFTSTRRGFPSLWRMDLDGGNLKQLTDRDEDYAAAISPDSGWILFDSWRSGRRTPWKISIDGGQPTQVIDKFTDSPRLSPDGKLIATFYQEEQQPGSPWRIMIASFDGGAPIKTFDPARSFESSALDIGMSWAADGRSLIYVDSAQGTTNLLSQPIDGGPAKQLTNFKENGVGPFAFSRDGKMIVFARGTSRSDVVLIRDFR